MDRLVHVLKQARWRLNAVALGEGLLTGVFFGALVALGAMLADRFFSYKIDLRIVGAAIGAAIVLSGAVRLMRQRWSEYEAAGKIDSHFGLKERLTTAYWLRERDEPFATAVYSDAVSHADRVDPRRVVQLRVPRLAVLSLIPLLLLGCAALFIPRMDLLHRERRALAKAEEQQAVRREGESLSRLQEQLDQLAKERKLVHTRKAAEELKRLTREFREKTPKAKQAMARISSLTERLKREKEALARERKGAGIRLNTQMRLKLAEALGQALAKGDHAKALQAMAELQEKLQTGALSPEQMERLAKELAQLSKALADNPKLQEALLKASQALNAQQLSEALQNLALSSEMLAQLEALAQDAANLEALIAALEEAKQRIGERSFDEGRMAGMSAEELAQALRSRSGTCPGCGRQVGPGAGSQCSICGAALSPEAGPEYGVGTSRSEQAGYDAQQEAELLRRLSQRESSWDEEFIKSFDPKERAAQTFGTRVTGQIGPGLPDASIDVPGAPRREALSVEAREAFLSYRETQKDAISREPIPLGYKEYVKRYFDSLDVAQPAEKGDTEHAGETVNP